MADRAHSIPVGANGSIVTALAAVNPLDHRWHMPDTDLAGLMAFGLRFAGGGAHQSKTMMLQEISAVWEYVNCDFTQARSVIIDDNLLNKRTSSARRLTFRHLNSLYAMEAMPPLTRVLFALWRLDRGGRPMLALLCALARDPLLRDSASTVLQSPVGMAVRWPMIAAALEEQHPSRFSQKMLKSLAQNCASSWTQSGHLRGAVRKERVRAEPTPIAAAYAALLGTVCGYGGPALLDSAWLRVLDCSQDQAIDLLRHAEGQGLVRVRSAGDVLEISVQKPMATALGIPQLA
jgi:hypothetical protein